MLAFGTAGPDVAQDRADLVRWAASAAAVLAVYAVAVGALLTWTSPQPPITPPPPAATLIDLAPLPPPPQPAVAPPPPPEPVKPREPKRTIKPPPKVALPLPPPRAPAPPKPVRLPKPRVVAPAAAPVPPPPVQVPPRPVAPAPAPVVAPPVVAPPPINVLSTFESRLMAHLERYKHYPQSARARRQQGVVRLRFVMDRSGRVISARIAQSSGVPALDNEVLAMIERAAPLPPFPPEITSARLDLLLPIAFSLR